MEDGFYTTIIEKVCNRTLVGIGESTHGTHEFFETKVEVFKRLVTEYGFNTLFLESVDDQCEALSNYLEDGNGNVRNLVNKLFYCYRTQEVLELFTWLAMHRGNPPIVVIGLDERKYTTEYQTDYDLNKMSLRDKRMATVIKTYTENNPHTKALIWAHDTHIATYINKELLQGPQQFKPMGHHLHHWYGKEYYAVSQLFGLGDFSAEVIDDTGQSEKGKLVSLAVPPIPTDFVEYTLSQQQYYPSFIAGTAFDEVAKPNDMLKKRSLGWGVNKSAINESYMQIELHRAFDAFTFFPLATASHRLETSK